MESNKKHNMHHNAKTGIFSQCKGTFNINTQRKLLRASNALFGRNENVKENWIKRAVGFIKQ